MVNGKTKTEAVRNHAQVAEVIEGWIEVSRKFGDEIPRSDVIIDTVAVAI